MMMIRMPHVSIDSTVRTSVSVITTRGITDLPSVSDTIHIPDGIGVLDGVIHTIGPIITGITGITTHGIIVAGVAIIRIITDITITIRHTGQQRYRVL
jgi:hypothetical protein